MMTQVPLQLGHVNKPDCDLDAVTVDNIKKINWLITIGYFSKRNSVCWDSGKWVNQSSSEAKSSGRSLRPLIQPPLEKVRSTPDVENP